MYLTWETSENSWKCLFYWKCVVEIGGLDSAVCFFSTTQVWTHSTQLIENFILFKILWRKPNPNNLYGIESVYHSGIISLDFMHSMNKTVEHTKLSSIEPGLYVPWWARCCVSSPSHRVGDSPGFWHQISAFLPWRRGDRERRELGPCLTVMPVPHKAAYCRHSGLPGADLGSETRYWYWYASALFLGASDQ